MFNLEKKVIVVTGGNGLLGREIVNNLRNVGACVISTDLFFETEHVDNFIMDITSELSVKDTIQAVLNKYERIDGWINNAYPRTKDWANKFENVTIDSWRKNVDMHLNGYFICSKLILEVMKLQLNGVLINMSSIYGMQGPDFSIYEGTDLTMPAAYSAIKGGIANLSKYLASYYGPFNVRVNTISPGGVKDNQPYAFVSNYVKKVPLRRMANCNDITSAIHFLLSDESSYITGHNLVIDGGWTVI
jgi:NAD(P)-dependent dehydrogenase (short-subunit alcohol dehydrogenase family)